jgi:hypothetical protein
MSRSVSARSLRGARGGVALSLALVAVAPSNTIVGRARAAAAPLAGVAGGGPSVRSMIAGLGGAILSQARTVSASATTVHVAGRSCAVAAGTPLAVLAAVRRAGGPGYALRDYGGCNSSPVNSGQLFVYSLGGEANRGQSGWEYKVDRVSGSTGAGDASGPRGDGRRLRSGASVLWFWCNASGGGCQRTLDLAPASFTVARGGTLSVTVSGYDNEGRGRPVAGAIATLGSDFASTGSSGRATLIAPSAPGRYALSATRAGLVPSFPETIVVR